MGCVCAAEKMGEKIIATGGVDSERQLVPMSELGTATFVWRLHSFFICEI